MTLFLSPADPVNARKSLQTSVNLSEVDDALRDPIKFANLIDDIGRSRPAYCWAARASKKGVFHKMRKGDEVLFSLTGTGRFDYLGVISATLISERFAAVFWQDSLLLDWPFVFFLSGMHKIDLPKPKLRKLLGYDENDRFQGLRTVLQTRLNGALSIRELANL